MSPLTFPVQPPGLSTGSLGLRWPPHVQVTCFMPTLGSVLQCHFFRVAFPGHMLKRGPLSPARLRSYPALSSVCYFLVPEIIFLCMFPLTSCASPARIEAPQRRQLPLPGSFLYPLCLDRGQRITGAQLTSVEWIPALSTCEKHLGKNSVFITGRYRYVS